MFDHIVEHKDLQNKAMKKKSPKESEREKKHYQQFNDIQFIDLLTYMHT